MAACPACTDVWASYDQTVSPYCWPSQVWVLHVGTGKVKMKLQLHKVRAFDHHMQPTCIAVNLILYIKWVVDLEQ